MTTKISQLPAGQKIGNVGGNLEIDAVGDIVLNPTSGEIYFSNASAASIGTISLIANRGINSTANTLEQDFLILRSTNSGNFNAILSNAGNWHYSFGGGSYDFRQSYIGSSTWRMDNYTTASGATLQIDNLATVANDFTISPFAGKNINLSPTSGGQIVIGSSQVLHGLAIIDTGSALSSIGLGAGRIPIGTTGANPTAAFIGSGTNIAVTSGSGSISVATVANPTFATSITSAYAYLGGIEGNDGSDTLVISGNANGNTGTINFNHSLFNQARLTLGSDIATGTASQSGTTITATTGTPFTGTKPYGMVRFANGSVATVIEVLTTTTAKTAESQTIGSQAFSYYYNGIQCADNGYLSAKAILTPLINSQTFDGTSLVFAGKFNGDANARFQYTADGLQEWGPGTTAFDTVGKRSGVATYRISNSGGSGGGTLEVDNITSTTADLVLNSAFNIEFGDKLLYRINQLKIDHATSATTLALGINVTGDATQRYTVNGQGTTGWGDGSTQDIFEARSAANTISLGTSAANALAGTTTSTVLKAGTFTASTGLLLPASGGTPTTLTYYERYTGSITLTGIWAASQTVTVTVTRVGTAVTMYMTGLQPTANTATTIAAVAGSIPARFCGANTGTWGAFSRQMMLVRDNGTDKFGVLNLFADGSFSISAGPAVGTNFAGTGASGFPDQGFPAWSL